MLHSASNIHLSRVFKDKWNLLDKEEPFQLGEVEGALDLKGNNWGQ